MLGSLAVADALLALCPAVVFALVWLRERRAAALLWSVAWLAQPLALLAPGQTGGGGGERLPALLAAATGFFGAAVASAAWSEVGGKSSWQALVGLLTLAAAASSSLAALLPSGWAQGFLLLILVAATLTAAALFLTARERRGAGMRLAGGALLAFGLLVLATSALDVSGIRPQALGVPVELGGPVALSALLLSALGLLVSRWENALGSLTNAHARLEEMRRRHEDQATKDPLTGLVNRRAFRDLVDRVRGGTTTPRGCVLVLDMDGLKRVNDTQGHSMGDKAIYRMARVTESALRPGDLPIRWGGDEFVVVLPGASLVEAEVARDSIQAGVRREGLSASGGLAAYGPDQDIVLALREADRLMYVAKRQRRDTSGASTLQLRLPLGAEGAALPPYASH
jgi:diguanylate cyclase (GGDEF)-like protein